MITLYEYMSEPRYWIAHDDDGYWLVPVRENGWSERTPFVGRIGTLSRVTDIGDIDLGLPGDKL